MARPEALIPGNCYSSVNFYDTDLLLPMIETLVYVGRESEQEEGRVWLFKEPESPASPHEQEFIEWHADSLPVFTPEGPGFAELLVNR